ncbi:L-glyceraldehyde 3-phosphate reductase [Parabacteroides sp. PF5-5]|uniref:L-glyceraldehyde 3-phosphate reductase n=1 Tax=unclassified Parabacteroides TaxID=2649774 RepID=UPI0024767DDC|nr:MULTISPECIES: L-glyceraldehyde 3-phosphate reductase [unclassified Parabacteroides]MDH6305564.1 L-glyceraldehyde 3-phosphate reductase [Parabacteroides sp. PH5-39]MDH6316396.1 L-glyceraldehyde 3-phosphate reductase [Parabacteroides sp. PF5-13]MDH6319881.1 L-glyceraldehyde 3-phosphate reductase [Parabacteroides sp. PH5-13]MDH6323528.1 L-glyceraldehyde 3-phosphate reductase [Parabacteroides sp. PH5-8]MDH6327583.1 L-glyceraldehyde 3-phosphate reductase [Parabacteroides sp. PH5-41]
MEAYKASEKRYDEMTYRRCGRSGILLPAISLGLWHNFGSVDVFNHFIKIAHTAFDNGITHFDLANNYGPVYGSAEENFGRILKKGLGNYRDELIISSKAGYDMWPGPYGDWGSRKYLMASLDQSLKRMGLDYVDIFYSHRPDPQTPIEETMGALVDIVRQGKALYVGISNYDDVQAKAALEVLKEHKVRCLIHQPKYSMFERWVEPKLLPLLQEEGVGVIAFSPLAQGLLTNRYLNGIPEDSRAAKSTGFLQRNQVTEEVVAKVRKLNDIAVSRGQTLAEMALAWLLKDDRVTSVLIGASSVEQLQDNLKALKNLSFSADKLEAIEKILA